MVSFQSWLTPSILFQMGNHGGASRGEVSTAMVVIHGALSARRLQDSTSTISQIDLVPTVASLFGLPIPKNNIGVVIEALLDDSTREEHVWQNALQLKRVVEAGSTVTAMANDDMSVDCDDASDTAMKSCLLGMFHRAETMQPGVNRADSMQKV